VKQLLHTLCHGFISYHSYLSFAYRESSLLLGMVYSEEMEPKRGQEYRDRVRCDALEKIGHKVYTLDDKHNGDRIKSGRHCQANFAFMPAFVKSKVGSFTGTTGELLMCECLCDWK